jgi:hypothetical protein
MARYKTYYQKGREKIIADNNMNPVLVHAESAVYNLKETINYIDLRLKDGENFSLFDMQYIDGRLRESLDDVQAILTREMINEHNKSNDTT